MIRPLLFALLLGAMAPLASARSASIIQDSTSYCDSLCLVPLEDRIVPADPPFMCDCMVIIGGGSTPSGPDDAMTAAEILDRMWAERELRVANVANYTVVQTTSSVPLPVVLYYEKEVIDGLSTFQLVSPAELADRQAAASGQPTAEDMGAGIVALADALGGLLSGSSPASANDAPPADDPSAPAAASSNSSQEPPGALLAQMLIEGLRDLGEGLRDGRARFEQQEGLMDDLFWNRELIDALENQGTQEVYLDGEYISCNVLYGDFWNNPAINDIDLGEGSEGYEIISARMWIAKGGQEFISFQPMAMEIHLKRPDGAPLVLQRTHNDFTPASPWAMPMPRRTKLTMEGITGMIQGAVDDVWTEVHTIHDVFVNDGPPTAEESAQFIADAMERLGLN